MPRLRDLMGGQYATQLSPQQQREYEAWRARLPRNLQGTEDYDLAAAFLNNREQAANGHLNDIGKKPNHMTFSTGSKYSTPETPGGEWAPTNNPDDWVFWASQTNLDHHSAASMADYFRQNEPTSAVVLPVDYNMPGKPLRLADIMRRGGR